MTKNKENELNKLLELPHGVQKSIKCSAKDRAEILIFLHQNNLQYERLSRGGFTLLVSKKQP